MCLQQDSKATTARNNKGRQRSLLREQRSNKGQRSPLLEQRNNKEQRSLLQEQRNSKEQRGNKGQRAWRAIWCARQSRCRYLL